MDILGLNWPTEPIDPAWLGWFFIWSVFFTFTMSVLTGAIGPRSLLLLFQPSGRSLPHGAAARVITVVFLLIGAAFAAAESIGAVRVISWWLSR